ncbi:MAG TPA: OsmC family protein [Thermoplasmata archaeon]|nr:OsmC family protein [Thermoplasmata archaeon]
MAEPENGVRLVQQENYRFQATFEGATIAPLVVDEPAPTGGGAGPSPVQSLALAVGQCMSSTLHACFVRSHVGVRPITTSVRPILGRNARGRLRVTRLEVTIRAEPIDPADEPKVKHCLEIFEDLCPVSGAVREGATITLTARTEGDPVGM